MGHGVHDPGKDVPVLGFIVEVPMSLYMKLGSGWRGFMQ